MSKEMLRQADEIRARFAVMESVPGSGYHDNDRNPTKNDIKIAPQANGYNKASLNLVPFVGEYEVVFVGEDADKALEILRKWVATRLDPETGLTQKEAKMRAAINKLHVRDVVEVPRLILRKPLWNDYMWILDTMGQGLSSLPFTEEE